MVPQADRCAADEALCLPHHSAPTHNSEPYCIALPSQSCSADKNLGCPTCDLWQKIKSEIKSGKNCTDYHYSDVHGSKEHPEWIIEPCFAVSGIEKILDNTTASSTNHLWAQEWSDAMQGKEGRPNITAAELGLVMNSFYYRDQHQMHIHAAKLNRTFAAHCLGSLPQSFKNDWVSPKDMSCNWMVSKYKDSLSTKQPSVNSMIIEGAAILKPKLGADSNLKTGALVSADPWSSGYIVTVFEGTKHGDHDILFYN